MKQEITKIALSYSKIIIWFLISITGALTLSAIALKHGETINSIWFITAAICFYLIGYRFYSAFIAAKVLVINDQRKTPAFKLQDGKDYEPTNKWVVFGHHFAAIAGPGPLIGPTLAAQFGYLPGLIWILIGSVIGGCVQDMVILFYSVRHDGKTLCQMAKDELGKFGGIAAITGTIIIMIILIAVLGLVVVNAMRHSPWAASTVAATIPIAFLVGIYMRFLRPGAVLEASIIGFTLLLLAVFLGKFIANHPILSPIFNHDGLSLTFAIIIYGFTAAVLPVWLLLAPRDYLSTFLKLGTIFLLALAIILLNPEIKMPALTQFNQGNGPIFGGKIFPFMFITIACGAISGFHSLIASGTTPKLIANEKDIRLIGYGAMTLESFVAIMALISASIMEPGIFFAINSPIGSLGNDINSIITKINNLGFVLTLEQMQNLAKEVGEESLFGRTGGAPSLAIGMASIFNQIFNQDLSKSVLSIWYHFIIMFEAIFILTTLDAGTRVCRFMLQDVLKNPLRKISPLLADNSSYPSILLTSFLVVSSWGYFLYAGIIDPYGGVNMLWPLFGMANQILAAIALAIATAIIIKSKQKKYCWATLLPLSFVSLVTLSAAWQKIFASDPRIGAISAIKQIKNLANQNSLNPEKIATINQLVFNQYMVIILTILFALILIIVLIDLIRIIISSNFDLTKLDKIIKKLNGNVKYEKYLNSFYLKQAQNNHSHRPLTKKEYFANIEENKWNKVNRCC